MTWGYKNGLGGYKDDLGVQECPGGTRMTWGVQEWPGVTMAWGGTSTLVQGDKQVGMFHFNYMYS